MGAAAIMAVLVVMLVPRAPSAAAGRVWLQEEGGQNGTAAREVTYDGRALILDGARRMLFSGDIHYPRSTPEYNFEGRYDLVKFIREVHAQGLYVSLRVGPFIEAEWKYGALPFWLHGVPNITFRSDNEPFKVSCYPRP
ncbi:hypothetical protein ACQ4PT_040956 [Festuca glaucescens]